MAVTGRVQISASIGTSSINIVANLSDDAGIMASPVAALAVAQPGVITGGTVTMTNESHNIETGDTVTAFWTTGGVDYVRYGCTVGTVSTVSVPLTGGAGTSLPTGGAAIVLGVESTEAAVFVGGDTSMYAASGSAAGYVQFLADDGTVLLHGAIGPSAGPVWYSDSGITNPLAGVTVASMVFTNGDTTLTNDVQGLVLHNGG